MGTSTGVMSGLHSQSPLAPNPLYTGAGALALSNRPRTAHNRQKANSKAAASGVPRAVWCHRIHLFQRRRRRPL